MQDISAYLDKPGRYSVRAYDYRLRYASAWKLYRCSICMPAA
jgi:hypothetical protein